ncbi:Glycerophosphocholine phosphodiesterase [Thoreauomyces humboldtii]|nr:Glycerophosphocholine phosphodiesterase [Thoreauomyces humboldtii]
MKFGRTLANYQVPEWSNQYLAYKALKRLIKQARRSATPLGGVGETSNDTSQDVQRAFIKLVASEALKVNAFFINQRSITERRIRSSKERLEKPGASAYADEELVEAINEIRVYLYLVLRYVEMNKTGFRKILKKFDKKLATNRSEALWSENLSSLAFCTDTSMENMLQGIDGLDEKAKNLQLTAEVNGHPLPSPDTQYLFPEEVSKALDSDDTTRLCMVLEKIRTPTPGQPITEDEERDMQASILLKACQKKARRCIDLLLKTPDLISTPLPADINQRTIIHRLVILGAAIRSRNGDVRQTPSLIDKDDPTLLRYLLERVAPDVAERALKVRDFLGRTALHYTALYGLPRTAESLMHFLPFGRIERSWSDDDGHSPLFYAVVRGFVDVVLLLLKTWSNVDDLGDARINEYYSFPDLRHLVPGSVTQQVNASGDVGPAHHAFITSRMASSSLTDLFSPPGRLGVSTPLALACTYGYSAIARVLLEHGADANWKNEDEETVLHLCARGGHIDCLKLLLGQVDSVAWKPSDVDITDRAFGRTALFLAAMEGQIESVRALLAAGANPQIVDSGSLNPHEHAVFRAHTEVAELLRPHIPAQVPQSSKLSSVAQAVVVERAYGHKYLKGQSMIRVYLGSTDLRRQMAPVQLDEKRIPSQMAPGTFCLKVSALGATGEPVVFDLPLLETVPDPIVFYAETPEAVSLQFDIYPAYGDASKKNRLIGRASALLSTTKTSLWQEKGPLGGSIEVPIMGAQNLDIIGRVLLEFVVVKPFVHSNFKGEGARTWRSDKTKLVGHRGMGMNKAAHVADGRGHLQLGENTLLSFITAGALGAEYVEFDVQLTKDLVPVLYHDFRVSETGYSLPLASLTASEFLSLRPKERPAGRHARHRRDNGNLNVPVAAATDASNAPLRRTMSMSDARFTVADAQQKLATVLGAGGRSTAPSDAEHSDAGSEGSQPSLLTKEVPTGTWPTKGNGDGSIQLPFATLEDALKNVPTKIGFNVEVKYPNLEEAEIHNLQNAEINLFCDRVLEVIFDCAADRNIYFSSFHPEVCWMLSMKQNHYPVFFLTEGGTQHTYDARCNTLLDAVRFATRSGCLGIVTAVNPILQAPGLVRAIRESGLLLFTYGAANNLVQNVRLQKEVGVDAVIVDKVKSVWSEIHREE